VNQRAAWIALVVSAICAMALLVYGVQQLGAFADLAVLAAFAIGLCDSVALSLWRRRMKAHPDPEDDGTQKMALPLKRATITYTAALALLGVILVVVGLVLPSPTSLVWIVSGALMLVLVGVIIVRSRQRS
jgi:peptidoglycan/LPS O-acetylase OafA/YrhL